MTPSLQTIQAPADLKALDTATLNRLAGEIRTLIIETISKTGGHLAANLGTVERQPARLKVFDPPRDKLIWDVSHQAYTYKILTGRRDRFATLRQQDGLSGFLNRTESPYDAFGAGHAGTALSAALGMAVARDRRGGDEHVLAIVGDGSMGCGSSLEALNNLAVTTRRLIVVLNDNKMSISANVGSMAQRLGELLANPRYNRWKTSVEHFAVRRLRLGWLRRVYYRIEESIKNMFLKSSFFEELGLRYIGPIDGHDLTKLLSALAIARQSDEPILLHVSTVKGKGYAFAEEEPEAWHGTGAFDSTSGKPAKTVHLPTYSEVFGKTLERLAADDLSIAAVTAAMAKGTGLAGFAERFPARFFDVGICEEHAVLFAAGLATEGLCPVVALYSTFAQRVVDYVIHDVCLQDLSVIFCWDRAGLVGDDGPTHHGVFDIALFRGVPNLIIMHPKDEAELAQMLATAVRRRKPAIIRYPRGCGPGAAVPEPLAELILGQAEVLRAGKTVQIWALGDMLPIAGRAADTLQAGGIDVGVVNPRFIVPLDRDLLARQAAAARVIVTLENGGAAGGFGSLVGETLDDLGYTGRVLRYGWPNQFIPHGPFPAMCTRFGLTPTAIATAVRQALSA